MMSTKNPERNLTPVQKTALQWLLAEGGRVRVCSAGRTFFKAGEAHGPATVCGAAVRELCDAGAIVIDGEWIEVTQYGCKQAVA